MITIRKGADRGQADRGWLKARFSFSFANYYDPNHMGFRSLRVLNDDRIAAGRGFGPHAHRDMEIVTYVLEGRLLHRDSTGQERTIGPNEVQAMSAGTGIVHSEFNASEVEGVHSIQIWIEPMTEDLDPEYQQVTFRPEEKRGRLRLLAGPASGPDPATIIHQDVWLWVADLASGDSVEHPLADGRHAWLQVVRGAISVNGRDLEEGDGAALSNEAGVTISGAAPEGGEVLLFDLQ